MAKRKTPKVKDLRPEKITDEQLNKLQKAVNNMNGLQLEIGSMEAKKHDLLHGIAAARDGLRLLQTEFENDYNTFDIDIQTGTINYISDNGETDKKD